MVIAFLKPISQKIAISLFLCMAIDSNSGAACPSDIDRDDLSVTIESALPVKGQPCRLP